MSRAPGVRLHRPPGPGRAEAVTVPASRTRLPACAALVALVPLLAACYVYQPVGLSELAPGDEVRVRVTSEAVDRAEPAVVLDRDVEGVFAGLEGEDFLLDVAVGTQDSGFRNQSLNQRIDLRTQDLLDVERRSLDQTRTGVVLGTVGAVAAVAAFSAFSKSGGTTSTTPPTPGDGIVVQILRFALPWGR